MKTELEIGDRVRVQNTFSDFVATINRITKTKAIGVWGNDCSIEFKRKIGGFGIERFSPNKWSTIRYILLEAI